MNLETAEVALARLGLLVVRGFLTVCERGTIDGFAGELEVDWVLSANDAFVGENRLVDFGIPEGFALCTSTGRESDTSSIADRRIRLAGLVFAVRADTWEGIGLKGLIEVEVPEKGGAARPGVPFPAVRGLSGSSRPALDGLLFRDCEFE